MDLTVMRFIYCFSTSSLKGLQAADLILLTRTHPINGSIVRNLFLP